MELFEIALLSLYCNIWTQLKLCSNSKFFYFILRTFPPSSLFPHLPRITRSKQTWRIPSSDFSTRTKLYSFRLEVKNDLKEHLTGDFRGTRCSVLAGSAADFRPTWFMKRIPTSTRRAGLFSLASRPPRLIINLVTSVKFRVVVHFSTRAASHQPRGIASL